MDPIEHNQPDLNAALTVLHQSLDALAAVGFPPHRVVLWGFSQGACLLAHYALVTPRRVAGMVLFTGGYLGTTRPALPETAALHHTPVVLRSVADDPWVPRSRVEDTATLLTSRGAQVNVRIDPGAEHVIHDEACAAATQLLQRLA